MKSTLLLFSAAVFVTAAYAQTLNFKVVSEGLAYRNLATVESNTEFETFTGRTDKVGGSFTFSPTKRTGGGKIMVDLASLDTGIALRNEHMRSEGWLSTDKYPTATFETTKVKFVKGENYSATGKFTMKGKTKVLTVPVRVKYRKESEGTKAAGFKGDVVQIFAKFDIQLSDFGVVIPAQAKGKVSNKVTLAVSAYATTK